MLATTTILLLISNAVTVRRDKSILFSRIAIAVLICCFLLCLNSYYLAFFDKGLAIYSGLLQTTAVSQTFHIFVFIITAVILILSSFYPRKVALESYSSIFKLVFSKLAYYNSFILNKMAEQYRILEYPLIIMFVVMGGLLLMSTSDLITLFLAIELQSYAIYILCVVYRDSEGATRGGLTYFLLGGLSSCFILLASGLLYGNSGNTNFDGLYIINNISTANVNVITEISSVETDIVNSLTNLMSSSYITVSLIIMSVGFLFKISAAPFHFWSPDVYDAIPTIVTTFVSTFAKISILVLMLELVHYTGNININSDNIYIEQIEIVNYSWTFTLLISSLLSLIVGAVLGLTQVRIKRLYAYSTISHIGFILLALSVNSIESIQSFIFYLMQYSITNVNAFILLIAVGYSLYIYVENTDEKNTPVTSFVEESALKSDNIELKTSPVQLISQLKGYFYVNPYIALSLAITLFSFVGIPPLLGFFAKQMVLTSALDKGYVFMVLVAILTSAVSAYYYLAIIKQMYFNKTDYVLNPALAKTTLKGHIINNNNLNNISFDVEAIKLSASISVTISILTLVILLFMAAPQQWLNMATILALTLFNY